MKYLTLLLFLLAVLGVAPLASQAQEGGRDLPTLTAQVEASYAQRSASWWSALERQLAKAMRKPYQDVDPNVLQNIVYFAINHGDKVNLRRTVPGLVEVYRSSDRPAARILALRALYELADAETMATVIRSARQEQEGQVQRISLALLVEYQRAQGL